MIPILMSLLASLPGVFVSPPGSGTYRTLSPQVRVDARALHLGTATLRWPEPVPWTGCLPEGTVRVAGGNTQVAMSAYRALEGQIPHGPALRLTALAPERVELQWTFAPGTFPGTFALDLEGGRWLSTPEGLVIQDREGRRFTFGELRAFQELDERPLTVHLQGSRLVFAVEGYDRTRPLVVDPVTALISASDTVEVRDVAMARDSQSVYVSGSFRNANDGSFVSGALTAGQANSPGCASCWDAFVTRLSPDLSVHYATVVLTSALNDRAYAVAVSDSGTVAVAGFTEHTATFSVNRAVFGSTGGEDAFVAVLDTALSGVLQTLVVATPDTDRFQAVAFDGNAHVYAAGYSTLADSLPASVAPHIYGTPGARDAIVAVLASGPTPTLMSSAVLAGSVPTSLEEAEDLVVEPAGGMVYLTGQTTDGAGVSASVDTVYGSPGGYDVFAVQMRYDLMQIMGSVLLASPGDDHGLRIRNDAAWSRIYVAGHTASAGAFLSPFAPTVHGPAPAGDAAFVVRLFPVLTLDQGALVTGGVMPSGAEGLAVGSMVALSGWTMGGPFAPVRQTYGLTGSMESFLTLLSMDLQQHMGTALLASPDRDRAYAVTEGPQGWILGGVSYAPQNFAENPPTYGYGTSQGVDGFVSLLATAQVAVTEGPRREAPALRIRPVQGGMALQLQTAGYVSYEVRDAMGRRVAAGTPGFLPRGTYRVPLRLPAGVYTLRVRSGDQLTTQRVQLMR